MGNGSKEPKGQFDQRIFHLVDFGTGMVSVVLPVNQAEVQEVGFLVPKAFGALYSLFFEHAKRLQNIHGFEDPTEGQAMEALKRYVKKLSSNVERYAEEALTEVTATDDWKEKPICPWDFERDLREIHALLLQSEDKSDKLQLTYGVADYNEGEVITNGKEDTEGDPTKSEDPDGS